MSLWDPVGRGTQRCSFMHMDTTNIYIKERPASFCPTNSTIVHATLESRCSTLQGGETGTPCSVGYLGFSVITEGVGTVTLCLLSGHCPVVGGCDHSCVP